MGSKDRRGRWFFGITALALAAAIAAPFVTGTGARATSTLFAPYQSFQLGQDSQAVAIGDVTGDGRADVVATTSYGYADYRIVVVAGQPDGSLLAAATYLTAGAGNHPLQSVAIGDITGDGRADVVVGASGLGIEVFPQVDGGTLGTSTSIATTDATKLRIANLDQAPGLDVVAIGWGSNTASVYSNDGNGHLGAPTVYAVPHGGFDDLEVGDVTGDGLDDIVVMSGQAYAIPNVSVLPRLAAGGFGPVASYRVGDLINSQGIGVGDVTGDGRTDVVASYGGNRPGSRIAIFAQTAGGALAAPVSYPSYDIPTPVEVADLDLDGYADIVTLHSGWQRAGVYRGGPGGAVGPEELYPLRSFSAYDPHGLAVGDITGDGWPDLAIADSTEGLLVLRNYGVTTPPPTPSPTTTASPSSSPLPTPSATPFPTYTPKPTQTPTPTASPIPVPGAPTLTSVTPADGQVNLAWTAPTGSGGSSIVSYTATATPGGSTCTINALGCVIAGLTNGVEYTFVVRATNAFGTGPASNARSATPFQLPSAPSGLTADPNLPAGVGLAWAAPSSPGTGGVTGYRIYRSSDGSIWTSLATVGTTRSFVDGTVPAGATFQYSVAAVTTFGEGPRSTTVIAHRGVPPGVPTNVAASAGNTGITVKWKAPTANGGSPLTGFRIYRGTVQGGETFLVAVTAGSTAYLDGGVVRKVRYYYRVAAVNNIGEGQLSTEVTTVAH